MSIGKKYTYWRFIQEHGIAIPLIQRDYAQGREGKAELRKRFLFNLSDALSDKDPNNPLILDFVYGVKDKNNNIIPLDGQQRLTTLWLLHWYIYLKSNKNITKDNLNILLKFTYQTRISSRKFCEELCKNKHFHKLRQLEKNNAGNIRYYITNQTWFMAEWEQDPTVKAMLNMLGGKDQSIESILNGCDFNSFWSELTLTDENKCPIVFYYLPIDGEIQQEPDDIYIKVNARGEHLTDFENFKADLIKFVRADKQQQWQNISNDEHPDLAISKLIDTDWTDVFWNDLPNECKIIDKNPPESTGTKLPNIDRQFFAFLNRYFVNCILIDDSIKADELQPKNRIKSKNKKVILFNSLYEDKGEPFRYKDFAIFEEAGVITPENFKAIKNIMKNLSKDIGLEEWGVEWLQQKEKAFGFLPQFTDNQATLTDDISQKHRIVFFGICCYLQSCDSQKEFCQDEYQAWMRYVWNIAYNSNVQDIVSMKTVMMYINESFNGMKARNYNIIKYLSGHNVTDGTSYFERQKYEERRKAMLFNNNKDYIINAENAFHGSIRFLLPLNDNQQSPDLPDQQYIGKAKKLLGIENANNLLGPDLWIMEILPYLSDSFEEPNKCNIKKEIIFRNDENDNIKAVNYSDDLVGAVQSKLKGEECNVDKNSWVYPLLNIPDLFDYSTSKKIQNYYYWEKDNKKKGIYLFKRSNWSEDSCILLYSFDSDTQEKVVARNKFIIDKIKKHGFKIYNGTVDQEAEDRVKDSDNPHFGRAIILRNDKKFYYCRVNGYYEASNNQIKYCPYTIE